jgi:hypothetical protein
MREGERKVREETRGDAETRRIKERKTIAKEQKGLCDDCRLKSATCFHVQAQDSHKNMQLCDDCHTKYEVEKDEEFKN